MKMKNKKDLIFFAIVAIVVIAGLIFSYVRKNNGPKPATVDGTDTASEFDYLDEAEIAELPDFAYEGNADLNDDSILKAVVTVNGQIVGVYRLDTDIEVPVESPAGFNKMVIKNGAAEVTEADCPDSICVYTYPASEKGALIVCLPHAMMVEIK